MSTSLADPKTLLCPVPCGHMDDAIATCTMRGRVAFASDVENMFYRVSDEKQLVASGTRVLIYVSQTGNHDGTARRHGAGWVTYEATYRQWSRADDQGKHRQPAFRPALAHEQDTPVMGFWEVSDLRRLSKPIALSELRTFEDKPKAVTIPRRPMYVNDKVI